MTTGERWQNVRRLFDEAAELGAAEREGFLRAVAEADAELAAEVRELLDADDATGEFLQAPPVQEWLERAAEPELAAGARVGRYRLLRVVGRGGMGIVYAAERADDEFRKQVAIKLVRRDVDRHQLMARFRRERQILATLEHPNIARLLDGGVTDDGQPYLVMEYVDGEPITEYCERSGLGVRERVELFATVCGAVHFAHQNLIVHRDLKPGNVMVTADGGVKLLDFGVAKLLPDAAGLVRTTSAMTELGGRMLTPAYASPEQLRGERITTASDVYSLGVLLYELLAGRRPFQLDDSPLEELARVVSAEDPTRPSDAVPTTVPWAAAEPAALRRTLAGELDNIVLMAIRPERLRRYSSAEQFADDLRRYLRGEPVVAQKDTAGYRFRKFVQRHRGSVAAAIGAGLLLLVAFAMTLSQMRRAEAERQLAATRFEDVRGLTRALLFDVHDAIEDLPGSTAARELILQNVLVYLAQLHASSGGDPLLTREAAEGYIRVGRLLGDPVRPNRGDLAAARDAYEQALDIAQTGAARHPRDMELQRTRGIAHEKMADVLAWTGSPAAGVEHARAALAIYVAIAEAQPPDEAAALTRATGHVKLADLLGNPAFPHAGDAAGAIDQYRRALAALDAPPLVASDDWTVRRTRALLHERLGLMYLHTGQPDRALAEHRETLRLRQRLEQANPTSLDARRDVAISTGHLCDALRATGDADGALAFCEAAFARWQALHEPQNLLSVADLAFGHEKLAATQLELGDWRRAHREAALSSQLRESILELSPDDVLTRRHLVRSLLIRAAAGAELGAVEAAAPLLDAAAVDLRRARDILDELAARGIGLERELRVLAETSATFARLGLPA